MDSSCHFWLAHRIHCNLSDFQTDLTQRSECFSLDEKKRGIYFSLLNIFLLLVGSFFFVSVSFLLVHGYDARNSQSLMKLVNDIKRSTREAYWRMPLLPGKIKPTGFPRVEYDSLFWFTRLIWIKAEHTRT